MRRCVVSSTAGRSPPTTRSALQASAFRWNLGRSGAVTRRRRSRAGVAEWQSSDLSRRGLPHHNPLAKTCPHCSSMPSTPPDVYPFPSVPAEALADLPAPAAESPSAEQGASDEMIPSGHFGPFTRRNLLVGLAGFAAVGGIAEFAHTQPTSAAGRHSSHPQTPHTPDQPLTSTTTAYLFTSAGLTTFSVPNDGVTDAGSAIQSAINAASGGGSILLPPGTYLISAPLSLGVANFHLHGAGPGTVLKAAPAQRWWRSRRYVRGPRFADHRRAGRTRRLSRADAPIC